MDPVVIVGGSLGGLRTAQSLRRFGYRGPITVVGAETHLPYNRPSLSKEALRAGSALEDLEQASRPSWASSPRREAIQ